MTDRIKENSNGLVIGLRYVSEEKDQVRWQNAQVLPLQ